MSAAEVLAVVLLGGLLLGLLLGLVLFYLPGHHSRPVAQWSHDHEAARHLFDKIEPPDPWS